MEKKPNKNLTKFSKKVVVFCIAFIVFYTILQTYLSYRLGLELSPTLTTCVYAFFGTELASTAIIRVFDSKYSTNDNSPTMQVPIINQDEEGLG